MWLTYLAVAFATRGKLRSDPLGNTQAFQWRTEGITSEIRANSASLRSKQASEKAAEAAASHDSISVTEPSATHAEVAKVQAELDKAVALRDEVKAKAELAQQRAYDSSKETAEGIVNKLKGDAAAYYGSLEQHLASRATVPRDAKADAAQEAAKPYTAAQLAAMTMVAQYLAKAEEVAGQAKAEAAMSKQIADKANVYQKQGESVDAARYMIQAHQMVGDANLKDALAKRLWTLAREINQNIPSYVNAAAQAAGAVMAR